MRGPTPIGLWASPARQPLGQTKKTKTKVATAVLDLPPLSGTCKGFLKEALKHCETPRELQTLLKEASELSPQIAEDLQPLIKNAGKLGAIWNRFAKRKARQSLGNAMKPGVQAVKGLGSLGAKGLGKGVSAVESALPRVGGAVKAVTPDFAALANKARGGISRAGQAVAAKTPAWVTGPALKSVGVNAIKNPAAGALMGGGIGSTIDAAKYVAGGPQAQYDATWGKDLAALGAVARTPWGRGAGRLANTIAGNPLLRFAAPALGKVQTLAPAAERMLGAPFTNDMKSPGLLGTAQRTEGVVGGLTGLVATMKGTAHMGVDKGTQDGFDQATRSYDSAMQSRDKLLRLEQTDPQAAQVYRDKIENFKQQVAQNPNAPPADRLQVEALQQLENHDAIIQKTPVPTPALDVS